MLYVLIRMPHRGDSNEYTTYNHCVGNRNDFPKLSLFLPELVP